MCFWFFYRGAPPPPRPFLALTVPQGGGCVGSDHREVPGPHRTPRVGAHAAAHQMFPRVRFGKSKNIRILSISAIKYQCSHRSNLTVSLHQNPCRDPYQVPIFCCIPIDQSSHPTALTKIPCHDRDNDNDTDNDQAGNDDDDDAAMAASQVIEAVSTVLQSTKAVPELFPAMEAHLLPMLSQVGAFRTHAPTTVQGVRSLGDAVFVLLPVCSAPHFTPQLLPPCLAFCKPLLGLQVRGVTVCERGEVAGKA